MPRSIWSGAISFGLVNVPVKLYSAVSRKTVRFHQLHDSDHVRIQQKRICPTDSEEVPYDNIVKGYEISPDKYVVIEPEELEALDPKKTRAIEIQEFVDLDEIDPIYFDHPYYLAPGAGAAKASREEITIQQPEEPAKVPDLMAALEQSLAAARGSGDGEASGTTRTRKRSTSSSGNGSKTTAKKKSSSSSGGSRSRSKATSS